MLLCRNSLGRGLQFEQLPKPFTVRNGASALSLLELLYLALLLVFGLSLVSFALVAELSDARGVSHLRRRDGPYTLRPSLPAEWGVKILWQKNSQNKSKTLMKGLFCMFFWACRGGGLGRWLTSGPAPACVSCCWGTLFPPTFLPHWLWGWRWAWPALLPPCLPPPGLRMRPPDGKAGGAVKEMATQTSGECQGTPFHVSAQLLEQ